MTENDGGGAAENDGGGAAREAAADTLSDRRRHLRVAVQLPGRYLLEDGSEHPCVCVDVSVGGARLRGGQVGQWGSRVIAYIDGIGRIEGYIVRRSPGWFAIQSRGSPRKGERVQERIATIIESWRGDDEDRRSRPREWTRRNVHVFTLEGASYEAELTDISREGAALLTEAPLQVDQRVRLDSRRARVVRQFPGGAALKFENWLDESWPPREAAVPAASPHARRA